MRSSREQHTFEKTKSCARPRTCPVQLHPEPARVVRPGDNDFAGLPRPSTHGGTTQHVRTSSAAQSPPHARAGRARKPSVMQPWHVLICPGCQLLACRCSSRGWLSCGTTYWSKQQPIEQLLKARTRRRPLTARHSIGSAAAATYAEQTCLRLKLKLPVKSFENDQRKVLLLDLPRPCIYAAVKTD
jgi:hypothetical protein